MRKLVIAVGASAFSILGVGAATVAHADPSVTLCHDVNINVNGTPLADAGCTTLPPAAPSVP